MICVECLLVSSDPHFLHGTVSSLSLPLFFFLCPLVSGLTVLNERTAQCQSALGKLQRGRKAKPSMRLSTCLIHTKERALKHKSQLVSDPVLFSKGNKWSNPVNWSLIVIKLKVKKSINNFTNLNTVNLQFRVLQKMCPTDCTSDKNLTTLPAEL